LDTPFSAHIDVCSVCNFKCSFCFQADSEGMKAVNLKRGMMPVELFRKIVDDLKLFPRKLKKVKIGNHGEPTLHPHLPEMIAYLRDAEVAETIEMFTNGSKLNPTLNRQLIEAGLQRVNISLEGIDAATYERVAGVRIDMDELVAAVADLYAVRGDCRLYVKIADRVRPLDKADSAMVVLSEADRARFFDSFGNICDEIYVENIVPQWARTQVEKQNQISEKGMYGQDIKQYKNICPFIFMYMHFNWDGTTSPCTLDWAKKVVVGHADRESVVDIWRGRSLRLLRMAQLQGHRDRVDFCNDCSAPMVCCKEDLDPYAAELLAKIAGPDDADGADNPWVGP
jgi:MoaA/NifB/PqqE/SkfB family radical SAM enzyme